MFYMLLKLGAGFALLSLFFAYQVGRTMCPSLDPYYIVIYYLFYWVKTYRHTVGHKDFPFGMNFYN